MIRVLHVIGRMAPGGTEHQLVGMLEAAQGRYWDATLCVLSTGWELTERAGDEGIRVVEIDGVGRFDPRRVARFRRLTSETDVVHASLWGASAFARAVTAGMRPALVISERGVEDHRHPALGVINRMLRPMTDAFIGNSTAVTDFIRRSHGVGPADPRVVAIPNGIDRAIFYPADRANLDPQRRRRLIGVGRLIASKRFEMAIRLLARLVKEVDLELVIAGDGPERGRLESLAQGLPVTFLGHLSDRHTLADLLRSGDVLVMPSASEGYPNAVLEALGCGLQVVASDVPGTRATAGVGVRLVDDHMDTWCNATVEALASPRVTTPQTAERILSFDDVARRHLDVFKAAIARRHRRRDRVHGPAANVPTETRGTK